MIHLPIVIHLSYAGTLTRACAKARPRRLVKLHFYGAGLLFSTGIKTTEKRWFEIKDETKDEKTDTQTHWFPRGGREVTVDSQHPVCP